MISIADENHTEFPPTKPPRRPNRPLTTRSVTASRPATPLSEALDEKVTVTENGRRQRVTKRELVIKQLVNKSASADLLAIKQLTDIVQGVERRTGASQALPSPPAFTAADEEVIAELKKRMERGIRAAIAAEKT